MLSNFCALWAPHEFRNSEFYIFCSLTSFTLIIFFTKISLKQGSQVSSLRGMKISQQRKNSAELNVREISQFTGHLCQFKTDLILTDPKMLVSMTTIYEIM